MPFKTSRGSRQGRPRRSRRRRGVGNSGSSTAHCASVRSIPSTYDGRPDFVSHPSWVYEIGSSPAPSREFDAHVFHLRISEERFEAFLASVSALLVAPERQFHTPAGA